LLRLLERALSLVRLRQRNERSTRSNYPPRSKRVLIIIQNVSFSYDTRIQKVARTLERAGYRVLIISPRYAGDPIRSRLGRVESWHYPSPTISSGIAGHLLEYFCSCLVIGVYSLAAFIAGRFSIVQIVSPPDVLFPLGAFYRALGCSVIVDVHDLSPELAKVRYEVDDNGLIVRLLRLAELAMARLATTTITTTDAQRELLAQRSGIAKERIFVIRNGIDLATVPNNVMHDTAGRTVGYLGAMNPQDGIELLLHAIHHIHHVMRRDDVRFLLIGDGDSHAALVKLAADLSIDDVATFTGRLSPLEALNKLASCTVCVQPDPKNEFTDTCCMVKTLEYMSLGKPIVAFGLSETKKCCGHAAVYADANSFVDLAEKILSVIDDPARGRLLGLEARKRLEQWFTWQPSEVQLLNVYRLASIKGRDAALLEDI
jgi:glycosyltransferase involved in cell wall biosynthesis